MPESLQKMVPAKTLADQIQHSLRILTIMTVVLYLALGATVFGLFVNASHRRAEIEMLAEDTAGALCTIRAERERSIANSEQFLKDHPDGFAGISADDIRRSIEDQKITVQALSVLECPDPEAGA